MNGVGGEVVMAARATEVARALLTLLLVTGAAAGMLAGLDAVPGWIEGEPRGVRRARSIDDAERRLRARITLPAYFPDTLRWPPSSVRLIAGVPATVALTFEARGGGAALLFVQTLGGEGPVPPRLLPEAAVLQRGRLSLGDHEATLSRVIGDDGEVWNELDWTQSGARFAMRGKGSLEDLVRMARSVHREAR